MLIDKDLRLDISDCFWLLYASKYYDKINSYIVRSALWMIVIIVIIEQYCND